MRYLGGKSKIARQLAMVIGGGSILVEPFMGGGAMTAALAPQFDIVYAYDLHPDLILLWQALQQGWTPPTSVSEEDYICLRDAGPSALRGFVGFAGASWGGKWFGGYARGGGRNYADEAVRSLARDILRMGNVILAQADYREIVIPQHATIYADPPYRGTTGYGGAFDSEQFWDTADRWVAEGATVFVSEYAAPSNWECVWEQTRTRDMKAHLTDAAQVTERLFSKGYW